MAKDKKKDKSDKSSGSSDSSDQEDKKSEKSDSSGQKSKRSKESSKNKANSGYDENESKSKRTKVAEEEKICATRREIEHSKWDSPSDKTDRKRKSDSRSDESKEKVSNKEEKRTKKPEREEDDERDSKSGSNRRRDDYNRHRDRDRDDRRDKYKNDRRDDRADNYNRGRDRSRSRSRDRNTRRNNERNNDYNRNKRRQRSRSGSFDHSKANWGKSDQQNSGGKDKKEKEKPNFGLSGKLTEETNTFKGVVIKYSEPPEARKPKRRWRLYPFKGEKAMQTLYIHRESAYLIGRDRKVVDLPVDHPSCSKQHAALQYRLVPFTREDGSVGKKVRPYLIDLESANGTYINNKKIDPKKYVELLERDVIKFGYSSREYVLLHENSKDEAMDDDVKNEEEEEIKKEPKKEPKE